MSEPFTVRGYVSVYISEEWESFGDRVVPTLVRNLTEGAMSKRFQFQFEFDGYLTASEIWPNGDGPDEPKTEDVLALLKEKGVTVRELVDEWALRPDSVYVDGIRSEV